MDLVLIMCLQYSTPLDLTQLLLYHLPNTIWHILVYVICPWYVITWHLSYYYLILTHVIPPVPSYGLTYHLTPVFLYSCISYLLYCASLRPILILNGTKCHTEQSATSHSWWGPPLESVGATSRIHSPHRAKCHTTHVVGATSWICGGHLLNLKGYFSPACAAGW